jgi:hypothetical protein
MAEQYEDNIDPLTGRPKTAADGMSGVATTNNVPTANAASSDIPPTSTAAATTPTAPVTGSHKNFSWENQNTNNWNDAEWEAYYQRYPDQRPAGFTNGSWGAAAGGTGGQPATETPEQLVTRRWTEMANQPVGVDRNDPEFRNRSDAYGANVERARRNYLDETAARSGTTANLQGEARLASERAGQAVGDFESELVEREIANQRAEIQSALSGLYGMVSDEERRALELKLAELDAAVRRESTAASSALGHADLGLRGELGRAGISVDILRAMLGNQQFDRDLGFRIGSREADMNTDALRFLFQ